VSSLPRTDPASSPAIVVRTLTDLEGIIERGLDTFVDVGEALAEIRDRQMYRETHATFEAYCRERWGWSRSYAYRHIEAAQAVALLPIGNIPRSESVARELVTLTPDARAELAAGIDFSTATAAEVKRAAREIKSRERKARDQTRINQRAEVLATAHPLEGERFRIFVHDIRTGPPDIARPAVVITDPPYPQEYLSLYGALDALCAAVLPDGGSLLAMSGQAHFDDVLARFGEMHYQWTLGYFTPGQSTQQFGRRVKCNWKPVVWCVNGTYAGEHVEDTIRSDGNDKRFHEWGQSVSGMAALIERFTVPGDLVYDPFCGGGTTGVAALLTGRLFVGSDIDEACVKQTAARLAEVAP